MSEISNSHLRSQAALSGRELVRVMIGVMLCILLAALDQTVVIPALPSIGNELNAYSGLSWIVAAYLITSTISTPIYSKLSDIYGRKRLLIVCITLFVASSLLCAIAQSLGQLIWFRALQGLTGGGLMALTQSALADVMSPRERGRYQAYISAVWAAASVGGPILGGMIAGGLSWRWIFWINLPLGIAAIWACQNGLRRLSAPMRHRPSLDYVGMLLLSGSLSLILLALGWGGVTYAWASYEIIVLFSVGFLLLFLLVLNERYVRDPLLPPRVFSSISYVCNVTITTITAVMMFICLYTIPLHFQLARGMTTAQSGIFLAPYMFAGAIGSVVGSRYSRLYGTMRGEMRVGTFLCFAGLVVLAVLPLSAPAWQLIAAMSIAGAGAGATNIGTMLLGQSSLSFRDIGAGTGAIIVLRAVGGATGSSLAGAIVAAGLNVSKGGGDPAGVLNATSQHSYFATAYLVAASLAAVNFIITLLMPDTKLRGTTASTPMPE
jgi:EmrB/QacA subfamily drug resistance transporter